MGSTIAGVKAGVIAGVIYVGVLALSNVLGLYLDKGSIASSLPQLCPPVAGTGVTTTNDCFDALTTVDVPIIAFVGFGVTLFFSGLFGRLYDHLPGRGPGAKGLVVAPLLAIGMILFQPAVLPFGQTALLILTLVLVGSTISFGLVLGKLYRRYTRVVQFVSQDESALKIIIGRSNLTGKSRTFAFKSSHEVKADVADDSSFRGWTVSGGVTVEDSKSFETSMEVNGDGLLKALVTQKS